jgi:hypothetical protein
LPPFFFLAGCSYAEGSVAPTFTWADLADKFRALAAFGGCTALWRPDGPQDTRGHWTLVGRAAATIAFVQLARAAMLLLGEPDGDDVVDHWLARIHSDLKIQPQQVLAPAPSSRSRWIDPQRATGWLTGRRKGAPGHDDRPRPLQPVTDGPPRYHSPHVEHLAAAACVRYQFDERARAGILDEEPRRPRRASKPPRFPGRAKWFEETMAEKGLHSDTAVAVQTGMSHHSAKKIRDGHYVQARPLRKLARYLNIELEKIPDY